MIRIKNILKEIVIRLSVAVLLFFLLGFCTIMGPISVLIFGIKTNAKVSSDIADKFRK